MKGKKILAVMLSASMVMGTAMTVMADDTPVDVNAPIYSFDVTDVIVPTTYAVAFNPEGLTVKTEGTNTSTSQILSKNYGIVNKSNKDKLITVSLTVEDQNTNSGITFVDTAQDVTDAQDGEYKIHLTAVPADATEVKVGTASADKDTAAAALGNVAMTGATANAVTLKAGENRVGFKLDKATYAPKSGSEVTLGGTTGNDVSSNYEISSLAAAGKGITAFTFGGEMNANADWFKLQSGIKISVVYTNETAPSDATVISGTGAMVTVADPTPPAVAPTFETGDAVGQIKYTAGSGDDALSSITKIEMHNSFGDFDGFNAEGQGLWPAATNANGVVTLSSQYLGYYTQEDADAATWEATITYTKADGTQATATVDVKVK